MDVLSIVVSVFLGIVTLVGAYVLFMSRHYTVFKRMGVKYLTPRPAMGSVQILGKLGFIEFHKTMYNKFHGEKMYGFFETSTPILVIRSLEGLREIMVKNFNCFVDRRIFTTEEPSNHSLLSLRGDHWRHVRNTVSPTFSSGKLKKMCLLVEQTAKSLTSNIRNGCREDKEIELKHLFGCYTMDVIANTGFGVSVDSLNNEDSPFVREATKMLNIGNNRIFAFLFLFPWLFKILNKFGIGLFAKSARDFFNSFLDAAVENRMSSAGILGANSQKRHDFIQIMGEEEVKHKEALANGSLAGNERKERIGLTRLEMQGQAFVFILAGYDTVSSVLSFTLFILAHQPDITKKIQEELDEVLAGKAPTYENVNDLVYLDMCINEAMRMYPPGFLVDRKCTQDCVVDGVNIPKGMAIVLPLVAIFNDPEYFPNPEEFDPERFTPENKASRHPFAFLPFGQGPRNCIGMRLAQMEMKMAIASVLLDMTPVPCSKSVYPPQINKFQLKAEDGLWVKFVPRK